MKDVRVIGHLEDIVSNIQPLDSHRLSIASLLDNENKYQSLDYEMSASTGLFNETTQ